MSLDIINDAISNLKNHERVGKKRCVVRPVSNLLINILRVFQREGYIGDFELYEDGFGNSIEIELLHRINDCGVIKPRFPVKSAEFAAWENRFLPAKNLGALVVTTTGGVMTQRQASIKGIGGLLLAYVY